MGKKKSGLVFAYLLEGGSGTAMNWDRIGSWEPGQGILWLHLDYADEGAKQWLVEESGLDEVSCAALMAEETRPRVVSSGNALLLILRGVNFNPGADLEDMVAIRMWFDEHRIISMRHRRVMAMDDINKSIQAGKGPDSISDFLIMAASKLTDRMADVISDIDDSVDELEDAVLTEETKGLRPKLAHLRRQTISMRRYISPQRDVLARLQNERVPWLDDADRVRVRELAERTARFVDDLDSARDRAAITQEELNNHLSEKMNKTMYVLSIVAAIFLPLGLFTGLLGINVGGIPGTENDSAFVFVSGMLVAFAVAQYLVFKKMKWI
ncbi:zinc transporter ZntB [Accumulibacter sp.]|jgi:zinc transporter|uniref:zinc transporter ZntB n=2 Tax=Accumulibacter sp. TaxID=2053492 RepID=UPI0026021FCC|nr:zinc transporter ZntB [Accumulibacter sp.]